MEVVAILKVESWADVPFFVAVLGLLILIAGIALYAIGRGQQVAEGRLLIVAGAVAVIFAGVVRAVSHGSVVAELGCILVLCGVVTLLGSGFFNSILPGRPKERSRPARSWVIWGFVFLVVGVALIVVP